MFMSSLPEAPTAYHLGPGSLVAPRHTVRLSRTATDLVGQPMFSVLAKTQELEAEGRHIIHFELGDPDFSPPREVVEATCRALNEGNTHYTNSRGLMELREAVCTAARRDFALDIEVDQVAILPGANSGIYWTVRCLVEEGEEILVPDPCFPTYSSVARVCRVRSTGLPQLASNDFRIRPGDVEAAMNLETRLIILNSPCNPTGGVLEPADVKEIYEIARAGGVYILSDEVYRKMSYGSPPASVSAFDHCRERTILLGGVSKAYAMTGFRAGYLIGPPELVKKVGLYVETVASCVAPFVQIGAVQALLGDQGHVEAMLTELRKRRDVLVEGLNRIAGIECLTPRGGIFAFPRISDTGYGSDEFVDLMLSVGGVSLVPGHFFGPHGREHVRISFTTSVENILEGLARIADTLARYPRSRKGGRREIVLGAPRVVEHSTGERASLGDGRVERPEFLGPMPT